MLFWKFVILYVLFLTAYLGYIVSRLTPDHMHAAGVLFGAIGAFLIGTITAFTNSQKLFEIEETEEASSD